MRYLTQRAQTGLTSLLVLFLFSGLVLVGCDSGGDTPETQNNLSGVISGQVVDKASSAPIEGATVTVAAGSLDSDGDTYTATTDGNGQFNITDVPVTTGSQSQSEDGEQDNPSASYGIQVETPDGSEYRERYRGQVELAFGNTESETPAQNLVANITFPVSKTNGTVTGRVLVGPSASADALSQGTLTLVQDVPVQLDANGNAVSSIEVSTTTTTDANGQFTFDNAVVGQAFSLVATIGDETVSVLSGPPVPANESTVTVEESITPPAFQVVDITPAPGADVSADTSFTFTFNRAVASNAFTSASAPRSGLDASGEGDRLVDELYISKGNKKALTADGNIPVSISYGRNRTELTVTPTQPLQNGFTYSHVAEGFEDDRFVDAFGVPLATSSVNEADFDFSVGDNTVKPAVPSVSFEDQNDPDDETIADDGNLNYTDNTVTAELRIDDIDNSAAEVKGYEVYYRSQNQTGRNGNGDQFRKVNAVSPEASAGEFNEYDGIIPANTVDDDGENFDDGELEFTATIGSGGTGRSSPLAADDGSYGPIEWKVRAVSVNNVRSDFTSAIVTADNTDPAVQTANANPADDEIVLTFDEALDVSTAGNASNYELDDSGGDALDIGSISVENTVAGGSEVTLSGIDDPNDATDGFDATDEPIEVTLDSGLQDLEGISLELDTDSDDDDEIDAN